MMVYSFELDERFIDVLAPSDEKEESGNNFSSMELVPSNVAPKKREARPIIGLIMDILDTVYKTTKSDMKRGNRFT